MHASLKPTLLYVFDMQECVDVLVASMQRYFNVIPINGMTALYDELPDLSRVDGVFIAWSPEFASAISRLKLHVAPRPLPTVLLAKLTPSNRVVASKMLADGILEFPPSPVVAEALFERLLGDRDRPFAEGPSIVAEGGNAQDAGPVSDATAFDWKRMFDVDPASRDVIAYGTRYHLTDRAFQVLLYLMSCPGQCCSRQAILDAVWSDGYVPSSDVVSTAIHHVRKILAPHPELQSWIRTVRGIGFVFEPLPVQTNDAFADNA